jgi:hypothetical protein
MPLLPSVEQFLWISVALGLLGFVYTGHLPLLVLWFVPKRCFKSKAAEDGSGSHGYHLRSASQDPEEPFLARWRSRFSARSHAPNWSVLCFSWSFFGVGVLFLLMNAGEKHINWREELIHTATYEVTDRSWECRLTLCENRITGCAVSRQERKQGSDDRVVCPDDPRFVNTSPGESVIRSTMCLVHLGLVTSTVDNPKRWVPDPNLPQNRNEVEAKVIEWRFSPCQDQLAPYPIGSRWEAKVERSGIVHDDTFVRIPPSTPVP